MRIDQNIVGGNPSVMQHRPQQGYLVLAVAVAISKDVGCGVRLISSDSNCYCYVAYVRLKKRGDREQSRREIRFACDQLTDLCRNLWRGVGATTCQCCIPQPSLAPRCCRPGFFARWEIGNTHAFRN